MAGQVQNVPAMERGEAAEVVVAPRKGHRRGVGQASLAVRIVMFLRDWPGSKRHHISTMLEANPASVSTALGELRRRKKVFCDGATKGAKWSLK